MIILSIVPLFIGTTELLLIGGLALLLFGGKKLPEMMRGLGKGVKEFKQGMNEVDTMINEPVQPTAGDEEQEEPQAEATVQSAQEEHGENSK